MSIDPQRLALRAALCAAPWTPLSVALAEDGSPIAVGSIVRLPANRPGPTPWR